MAQPRLRVQSHHLIHHFMLNIMTTPKENPNASWIERMAKKHGANIFLVLAVGYLLNAQREMKAEQEAEKQRNEAKFAEIQNKLFDCYESRIRITAHNQYPIHLPNPHNPQNKEAILTGPKKKYSRFRILV